MIRFLMDPPQKYKSPRAAGLPACVVGALMLAFAIYSVLRSHTVYPWVWMFGCLGFSYGLWVVALGVPRAADGEPEAWWAYTGFAFWIASIGVGVWLGFFYF